MELVALRQEHFAPLVGEAFHLVTAGGGRLELTLVEAKAIGGGAAGRRTPFSLLWRGPLEPVVPQGTYPLQAPGGEESLGRLELFIVPVGPSSPAEGEAGMLYQAIFT